MGFSHWATIHIVELAMQINRTLHIWLFPILGMLALMGFIWVRGRNFVSVGADWRLIFFTAAALALTVTKSSPFKEHRSLAALILYGAVLLAIGFVAVPATYTAAFGTPFSRSYVVHEKVQLAAGGCSLALKFSEFDGRLDNHICVSHHIYKDSDTGTTVVASGRQSRLGIWLDDIALHRQPVIAPDTGQLR
jgi:hypothetical protein